MSLQEFDLRCPGLPLAVYREIASHLSQIDHVTTELLPQDAQQFDYALSQVGWLRIRHPRDLATADQERLQQILDHYGHRFGKWMNRAEFKAASPE